MAFDLAIGTMTIYCEASNQGDAPRLGVAFSFVNRLADPSKRYGVTVAEVCLRRYQYSEWNADLVDNANLLRAARVDEADPTLQACERDLKSALEGTVPDPTSGATHYHDTSIAPPSWTQGATRTCQLGRLVFYKGVK
jgi:spore germination cell wall hydrolase CwlJ-like protein